MPHPEYPKYLSSPFVDIREFRFIYKLAVIEKAFNDIRHPIYYTKKAVDSEGRIKIVEDRGKCGAVRTYNDGASVVPFKYLL